MAPESVAKMQRVPMGGGKQREGDRDARLAEALRANLKRRKVQTKGRGEDRTELPARGDEPKKGPERGPGGASDDQGDRTGVETAAPEGEAPQSRPRRR